MKIAIVGLGVIGRAVEHAANGRKFSVLRVDPAHNDAMTLEEALAAEPDAIFLCLPTPSRQDGTCDVSIMESSLSVLAGSHIPVISHSTAPWACYEYWQYRVHNLVHVPEFVTAADANNGYANQTRLIVGGNVTSVGLASAVLGELLPSVSVMHSMKIGEAAMIKYIANSFLAMKVVFANQMRELSHAAGMQWDNISQSLSRDPRLGSTHWQVPGPDGSFGFGGMCFPKDLDAFLVEADRLGIGLSLLEETKKANKRMRNKRNQI